jgi:serine/threonine protein kinase
VILFQMARGLPPFFDAKPEDEYYKPVIQGRWDIFWSVHMGLVENLELNQDLKELLEGMLEYNPDKRWSLEQVLSCAWFKGAPDSHQGIIQEMEDRKLKIIASKKKQKMERAARRGSNGSSSQYMRGSGENDEDRDDEESVAKMLKIKVMA